MNAISKYFHKAVSNYLADLLKHEIKTEIVKPSKIKDISQYLQESKKKLDFALVSTSGYANLNLIVCYKKSVLENPETLSIDSNSKLSLKKIIEGCLEEFFNMISDPGENIVVDTITMEPDISINKIALKGSCKKLGVKIKPGNIEPVELSLLSTDKDLEKLATLNPSKEQGLKLIESNKVKPVSENDSIPITEGNNFNIKPSSKETKPPQETGEEFTRNLGRILDIELPVSILLGKTEILLKKVLTLSPGAVIELDKDANEPVELVVNNRVIAKGEIVDVNGNFAFRVTEIETPVTRIKSIM